MKLTYREVYNHPQYSKYSNCYSDFRNRKLEKNFSIIYIEDNMFKLGYVECKDYVLEDGTVLIDFPYIKTVKKLIPSDGNNSILI